MLLALVSILLLGRWIGKLFAHFGQPRVIGEMIAGIMLGPSLLGQVWPAAKDFILPAEAAPYLGIISQIGIILYMFLGGPRTKCGPTAIASACDRRHFAHEYSRAVFNWSESGPLALPVSMGLKKTPFTSFALFMGVAMSITAFPVLRRILTDRRMENTELGRGGA